MKTKERKELHTKTIKELQALLQEAKAALALIRLEKVQNMLKDTSSYPRKRKDVATIETVLREKEQASKE